MPLSFSLATLLPRRNVVVFDSSLHRIEDNTFIVDGVGYWGL